MTSNENKVKVLIVGGFPAVNGRRIYGGQVAACMRLLDSSFVRRHVVSTLDTTQISNPPPPFAIRLLWAGKRLVQFSIALLFRRPDVVIIFLADSASAIEKGVMAWFARACRVPVLVFPRAGGLIRQYFSRRWFAALVRGTLGRSNVFLCQGLSFQRFAIQELGFSPESAPIIPNWTASDEHLRIGARRDYRQETGCPHILFLGWLEEFKGVFELLEAVRALRDAQAEFHLTLGGDGTALPKARQFVEAHQMEGYVTFAGWVNETAKASLLEGSQIFVLPSWSEGLPNAMIEAMSAGLACVVTEVGMIPDYVVDGRDALLVEPRYIAGLVEALKALLYDTALRKNISESGFKLANSNFTLENGAELLSAAVTRAVAIANH